MIFSALIICLLLIPSNSVSLSQTSENIFLSKSQEKYSKTPKTCNPPVPPLVWTEDFEIFYISNPIQDTESIFYNIDWGDGSSTNWIGPYNSNEIVTITHIWPNDGSYTIKSISKNKCFYSKISTYSLMLTSDLKIFNPIVGYVGVEYIFTIYWTEDEYYIIIDWGDETYSDWLGPYFWNVILSHNWEKPGEYYLRVRIRDLNGVESEWFTFVITIKNPNKNIEKTINNEKIQSEKIKFEYNLEFFPLLIHKISIKILINIFERLA